MTREQFYEASLERKVDYLNNCGYEMIDMYDGSFITFNKSEDGYDVILSNFSDTEFGKLIRIDKYNNKMEVVYLDENEETIVTTPRFVKLVKETDIFDQSEDFSGIDLEKVKNELVSRWERYEDQTSGNSYYEEIDGIGYSFKIDYIDGSVNFTTLRIVKD